MWPPAQVLTGWQSLGLDSESPASSATLVLPPEDGIVAKTPTKRSRMYIGTAACHASFSACLPPVLAP